MAANLSSDQATRVLSHEERSTYDELGYVIVPNVFPAAELSAIDFEIDRVTEQMLADRRRRRRTADEEASLITQLGMRSPVSQKVAQDERVLTLIQNIVTPGIAIYSIKLVAKPPFTDIPCHWHQDDAYYVKHSQSQTRMSVWIPLQDAHKANGCLWVVPKSHTWGLQQHSNKDHGVCRLSMHETEIEAIVEEQAIPVAVPAGAAVLFSARLWHGSKGNNTEKVRRAFITSYQEATAVGGNGAQWKILRAATNAPTNAAIK